MTATEPRLDVERESLIRMSPIALRQEGDGTTLVGYAAVFNEDTVIDSWEGHFVERIAPGAFRKTLRERRDQIKVLFNHGMDPQIGDKPLGKPTVMKEDERGLYVEVPLDPTSYNRDIIASLASGALDGMSFRMTVVAERWEDPSEERALPVRTIREVKLYEFGPVTFPAYEATMAGVRAHAPAAFEAWRSANKKGKALIGRTGPEITVGNTFHITESSDPGATAAEVVEMIAKQERALSATSHGRALITDADTAATFTGGLLVGSDVRSLTTLDPEAPEGDTGDQTEEPDAPELEPAAEATRDDEAATTGTPSTYQPAQPPVMTPERRESQRGLVRALYAQFENRNP